jgi:hypothetical protein
MSFIRRRLLVAAAAGSACLCAAAPGHTQPGLSHQPETGHLMRRVIRDDIRKNH